MVAEYGKGDLVGMVSMRRNKIKKEGRKLSCSYLFGTHKHIQTHANIYTCMHAQTNKYTHIHMHTHNNTHILESEKGNYG